MFNNKTQINNNNNNFNPNSPNNPQIYNDNNDINKNQEISNTYKIRFSIRYETSPGQNIYIFGNLDELGNWKKNTFKLKWSEGHIWKGTLELNKEIKSFEYKFVCLAENQSYKRWEEGFNRIFLYDEKLLIANSLIKMDCKWESFLLEFNIYYPLKNDCEYMQLVGGAKGIGNWLNDKGVPCKMKLSDPKQLGCK
jgi:hypothetical protein